RYMSPEQALAQRVVVDHRTDVYSLGVTLYELLTLEPVYSGQDRQELLRQLRARANFHLKNYVAVLADLSKAVELKPDDFSNLYWIPPAEVAKCPDPLLRNGLLELAEKTIRTTKNVAGAYAVRALLYSAFGQPEKATADLEKAVQIALEQPDKTG